VLTNPKLKPNKYIPNRDGWENLTSNKITSWLDDETNPTVAQYSPEKWAQRFLCNPYGFNAMLDTKRNSHPICDHSSINPKDYDAADGSSLSVDDGTLTRRWTQEAYLHGPSSDFFAESVSNWQLPASGSFGTWKSMTCANKNYYVR
jgi:hypothetical protein